MQNKDIGRHTLAILVDNEFGVLSQITRLIARKGFNIESIASGPTEDPEITRITMEILADEDHALLIINQLRKLIPVHSVKRLDGDRAIRRELMLIKIKADTNEVRNEAVQIASIFRASVIDISPTSLTIALIGEEDKMSALIEMLKSHGILELARTGIVALERGASTINEETKEKGEFNYSKNLL